MRWMLVTLGLFACSEPTQLPVLDCAAREECRVHGRCTQNMTSCYVADDTDCAKSEACRLHGACTASVTHCTASRDEDCARAEVTRLEGRVESMPMRGGAQCVRPLSEAVRARADCIGTSECHDHGLCQTVRGTCRATHSEHCVASLDCARWGRCTLSGGECIATSRRDCEQGSQTRGFSVMYGHCYDPDAPIVDPASLPSTAPDVEGTHEGPATQEHARGPRVRGAGPGRSGMGGEADRQAPGPVALASAAAAAERVALMDRR